MINLPENKTFCFLGAGVALRDFITEFSKANAGKHTFFAITDANIDQRWSEVNGPTTEERCHAVGCELIFVSPNAPEEIKLAVSERNANVAVILGWNKKFPNIFLEHFDGRVFNFHPIRLPQFRGPGGGFSWGVLHQESSVEINFHLMTETIDAGDIVFTCRRDLGRPLRDPQEYVDVMRDLGTSEAFPNFSNLLIEGRNLSARPQSQRDAEYYPRLETATNGAIDFSWTVDQICVFVRAFGRPYEGANFSYRKKRYSARRSEIVRHNDSIHPFSYGLIANHFEDTVHVITNGGVLALSEISDEDGRPVDPSIFLLGYRFYNDADTLLLAKLHHPTGR